MSAKLIIIIYLISFLAISIASATNSSVLPADISDYSAFFDKQFDKAINGDAEAQLYIGAMYEKGLAVDKDLILSHVYYNLAAASGEQRAITLRKDIEKQLTKEDFANARKLAKLFVPGKGVDHPRQTESIMALPKKRLVTKNTADDTSAKEKTNENVISSDETVDLSEAFYYAIESNNVDDIKILASAGADVNQRFDGSKTPLMIAADLGNIDAVTTLLDLNANVNLKSNDNKTALDFANASGHKYIAAVLKPRTIVSNRLTKDIQRYLSKLGYSPGYIDGIYGSRTKRALKRYAKEYNQQFEPQISTLQLDALKYTYNDLISNRKTDSPAQKQVVAVPASHISSNTTSEKDLSASTSEELNKTNQKTLASVSNTRTISSKSAPRKNIGNFPDITGVYKAKTTAIFSQCGEYNKTIEYFAEETIKNLNENGNFNISYKAPLINCTGKGKFIGDSNQLKGKYFCSWISTQGTKGTLQMNFDGVIEGENIHIKYKGKDTTPGILCNYDWERTLSDSL